MQNNEMSNHWITNEYIVSREFADKHKGELDKINKCIDIDKTSSAYNIDAWNTIMTAPICTNDKPQGISLEKLKQVKEEMDRIKEKTPEYDSVVTNQYTYNKYAAQLTENSTSPFNPDNVYHVAIFSLPFFICVDAIQAQERFNQLTAVGKKPFWFVEEENTNGTT